MVEPDAQQPKLYYRDGLSGAEHLLIDPGMLGKGSGTHYALDYYQPSRDGKLIAYGLSAGGSEASVLHIMDVATGKVLPEAIDRSDNNVIAWRDDNRSFFYLRYNKPTPNTPASETEYNARTYLHTVGAHPTGDGDAVVFGRGVSKALDVPEGQGTFVLAWPGAKYVVAAANHNMDDNPSTYYIAPLAKATGANTPWHKFADVADGVVRVAAHGDTLYFLSQKGASHFRLLATPLAKPDVNHAQVIVPEGEGVLTDFSIAREGLYVRERDGAVSKLTLVSFDGKQKKALPLPYEGNVDGATTDPREAGALFDLQSWVKAPLVFNYDPATDKVATPG
jgi:prolyl oligopeptidase